MLQRGLVNRKIFCCCANTQDKLMTCWNKQKKRRTRQKEINDYSRREQEELSKKRMSQSWKTRCCCELISAETHNLTRKMTQASLKGLGRSTQQERHRRQHCCLVNGLPRGWEYVQYLNNTWLVTYILLGRCILPDNVCVNAINLLPTLPWPHMHSGAGDTTVRLIHVNRSVVSSVPVIPDHAHLGLDLAPAHAHMHTFAYKHTVHPHLHMHACTHTHTHTYTHAHICI